jgi:hypothetical protein
MEFHNSHMFKPLDHHLALNTQLFLIFQLHSMWYECVCKRVMLIIHTFTWFCMIHHARLHLFFTIAFGTLATSLLLGLHQIKVFISHFLSAIKSSNDSSHDSCLLENHNPMILYHCFHHHHLISHLNSFRWCFDLILSFDMAILA